MKSILSILILTSIIGISEGLNPNHISPEISWPEYRYDTIENPLTEEKIYLGRVLFYDPILSADSTISCASCHSQYSAFTHVDHKLSHGIGDSIGTRNSPSLMNLAYQDKFMWDGAIHHLDMQALAPISNPLEMGETLANVVNKINRLPKYRQLYKNAFGDTLITGELTLKAIATFMLTLESKNSKFDQFLAGKTEFTEQEQKGFELFQDQCASCHKAPLFAISDFANNGLPIDPNLKDLGRMNISNNPEDSLKFKIPTLRNIEFSYPYMHDGRFKTLREVLNHYSNLSLEDNLDTRLNKINLTDHDKTDLTAFLLTLTDKEFLFNKDFGFPFDFFYPPARDSNK